MLLAPKRFGHEIQQYTCSYLYFLFIGQLQETKSEKVRHKFYKYKCSCMYLQQKSKCEV